MKLEALTATFAMAAFGFVGATIPPAAATAAINFTGTVAGSTVENDVYYYDCGDCGGYDYVTTYSGGEAFKVTLDGNYVIADIGGETYYSEYGDATANSDGSTMIEGGSSDFGSGGWYELSIYLYAPAAGRTDLSGYLTESSGYDNGETGGSFRTVSYDLSGQGFLAVPEPAAWTTMLIGVGAVGVAFRQLRRRTKVFE